MSNVRTDSRDFDVISVGSGHHGRSRLTSTIETNQTRAQLKDPEYAVPILGKTLLSRPGQPEEMANVALFLRPTRART